MKSLLKSSVYALTLLAAPAIVMASPAAAQSIKGLAVVDQNKAVADSSAFRNSLTARQTTYKPQIDQATTLMTGAQSRAKPLLDQFEAERTKPTPNQETLRNLAGQIQKLESDTQNQRNQILQPLALSEAYVLEQIGDQYDAALKAAMATTKSTVVLDIAATASFDKASDITAAVTTELNRLLPNAQIVPPTGWLPRAQREQLARQQAAAAAQPAPTATPPSGR
jgi:Skp family chaperone for outer membrane proteins